MYVIALSLYRPVYHTFPRRSANRACKLFNIRLYATLCFYYFRWHRRMFSYDSVFELLICWLRNGVFNFFIGRIIPKGKLSHPGSQKTPRRMTGFWRFCLTRTYVMLNPQCDVSYGSFGVRTLRHFMRYQSAQEGLLGFPAYCCKRVLTPHLWVYPCNENPGCA